MTDTEMELLFRNMIEFLPHDRHNKVWSADGKIFFESKEAHYAADTILTGMGFQINSGIIGVGPNEELWYFIALRKR